MGVKTAGAKAALPAQPAGGRVPIDDLKIKLIAYHEGLPGKNRNGISRACRVVKILKQDIGMQYVDQLADDGAFEEFDRALVTKSYSDRSVINLRSAFKRICRLAIKWEMLTSQPNWIQGPIKVMSIASTDVGKLLDYLGKKALEGDWKDHQFYALVAVVVYAGLWVTEAIDICMDDLVLNTEDLDGISGSPGTIHVDRTNQASTTPANAVPIIPCLARILAGWLKRRDKNEWLFYGERRMNRLKMSLVSEWLTIAGRGAGLTELGFPALRQFHLTVIKEQLCISDEEFDAKATMRNAIKAGGTPDDFLLERGLFGTSNLTTNRYRERALTRDEAIRLLKWLSEHVDKQKGYLFYAYFATALFVGLGQTEISMLKWDHMNLQSDPATILMPDHDLASLELQPEAAKILMGWRDYPNRGECDWVFPNKTLSGPMRDSAMYEYLRKAANAAGIQGRVTLGHLQRFGEVWGNVRALAAASGDMKPPELPGKLRSRPSESSDFGTGPDACAITIRRSDRMAFVFGIEKGPLSFAQARVINMLRNAGPRGLTLPEMKAKLGTGSGRTTITRLKEIDSDWDAALPKPGVHHGRYRIAPMGVSTRSDTSVT